MKESLNQFQESNKRSIRGTQKNRIRGFKESKETQGDPKKLKETQKSQRDQKRPKETLESGD